MTGPNGQVVDASDTATNFHLEYHSGTATVHGGAGSDAISYSDDGAGVSINLAAGTATGVGGTTTFTSIENAYGGGGNDTITGSVGANTLTGGGGDDTLDGGAEKDTAAYATTLALGDVVANGTGGWTVNGGADEGTDTLSNVEFVEHGGGRYVLFGNGGFATLKEAVEAATHPGDTIKFAETPTGPITIDVTDTNDDINVTIPYDVPTDIHTGDGDNHIVTGGADDHVTTGTGDDTIKTGDGNDVVDTGSGDDTIIGGSGLGDDVYDGGPNADTVIYSSATNSITVDLNAIPRSGQPVNGADGPGGNPDTIGELLAAAGHSETEAVGFAQGVDIGTDALISVENVVGGSGDDTIIGNGGANVLSGGGGDNTLTGGGGADTLIGDLGTDTAQYTAAITSAMVASDGAGHFIVTTGGAEGTDTLSGIEKIDGAGTANILLVGNGGYATIQAAIDAAVAGDTIMLAAGTYDEDIVLDRAVTILGANHGVAGTGTRGLESVITGGFEITGAGAVIDGVRITGGALAFGSFDAIHVSADNVTITNSVLQGAGVADTFALETEAGAGITGLVISNNLIAGWNDGVSLQQGTEATITGNTLQDMVGLALRLDGPAATTSVTGNFFLNNPGTGHIGVGVFDGDLDVGSIIGANTLDASGGRIGIFANDDAPQEITGTQFGDFMFDNSVGGQAQVFHGGGGNDVIMSGDGADTLDGGTGADAMTGGAGNDTYIVDDAGDTVTEALNEGTDLVQSSLSYTLGANVDNLTLTGSANINGTGNGDANVITGNSGNNTLDGGAGADTMTGGLGNDSYVVDDVGDTVTELSGEGTDLVQSSVSYTLGANVDNLTLTGSANINGTGNGDANVITGNSGNNTLDGGAGADTMTGGLGNDTYVVDNVDDVVTEALNAGTDTVQSSINYGLGVNVENLTLTGSAVSGNGNNLDNTITGNSGNNNLSGLGGADTMIGGAGDDNYIVDDAGDVVVENANEGVNDFVVSTVSYTLSSNVESLSLSGAANIDGTGNNLNNTIIGNAGDNILDGGVGADSMGGGFGNDTYVVDDVDDVVIESLNAGTDTVQSSIGYVLGTHLENLTLIGSANINGTGNSADNTLVGNIGDNTLDGGAGADSMSGGAGNDTYVVDNAGDTVTELSGEGTDTVKSSLSYTLGSDVENLTLTGVASLYGVGNSDGNVLTGNGAANFLVGLAGNDTLDGGAGADGMMGGTGNDMYVVDNAGDFVVESANEGTDTVDATVSYRLTANVENLALLGSADLQGYGNADANMLIGNSGNNFLDGDAGADIMLGGLGNDAYFVDNAGDQVIENPGEGNDTVFSTAHFRLSADIDNLVLVGSTGLQGYGNSLVNLIYGTTGDDILDGAGGADVMIGGAGNDAYIVDNASDFVFENPGEGADTVYSTAHFRLAADLEYLVLQGSADLQGYGNSSSNAIVGNTGNNLLNGEARAPIPCMAAPATTSTSSTMPAMW